MNINRLGLNTVSIKFSNLEEMAAAAAGAGFRTIECPLDQIRRELAKGMTPAQARAIIKEVAIVTATWRETAKAVGARSAEISRMASAFEHDDLKRALAL